ncbi:Uncharacterised protein [Klebsiella pneumoniae]|nr:Uncharacterised protein [Klebsiella pneumoniae]
MPECAKIPYWRPPAVCGNTVRRIIMIEALWVGVIASVVNGAEAAALKANRRIFGKVVLVLTNTIQMEALQTGCFAVEAPGADGIKVVCPLGIYASEYVILGRAIHRTILSIIIFGRCWPPVTTRDMHCGTSTDGDIFRHSTGNVRCISPRQTVCHFTVIKRRPVAGVSVSPPAPTLKFTIVICYAVKVTDSGC